VTRAKRHAHEILIQDDASGNTALHVACRLDPPEVVVEAPKLHLFLTNAEGSTPLHVAATNRCSADVIRSLLNASAITHHQQQQHPDRPGNLEDGDSRPFSAAAAATTTAPSPVAMLTRIGRAPIHYACLSFRGLSVEAFQVLLEATLKDGYVTSAMTHDLEDLMEDDDEEEDGDSTTMSAVSDEIKPVTSNVLTMRDSSGQTPLGLLFRRYRERVRCVIQAVERLRSEQPSLSSLAAAMTVHADLGELWEKARLIVTRLSEERMQKRRSDHNNGMDTIFLDLPESPGEQVIAQEAADWAAERHRKSLREEPDAVPFDEDQPLSLSLSPPRAFRIVHASVSLIGFGCPPEMIRLALSIHPEQVSEMDEDGNLPLHIAACAASAIGTSLGGDDDSCSLQSILSELSFLSTATACTNAFDKVIRILLHQYPAAARIPQGRSGKLPLLLSLENRTWDDGIKTMLDAFPSAVHSRKFPVELYPWMLARIGNRTTTPSRPPHHPVVRSRFGSMQSNISISRGASATTLARAVTPRDRNLSSLFETLRAKPDLITLGYDEQSVVSRSTPLQ